jgi:di/tricarboxylate transporter
VHALDEEAPVPRWDGTGARATVRVSAPEASGVGFGENNQSEVLVPIDLSSLESGLATVWLPYSVNSLIIARDYAIELDVSAPLTMPGGTRFQDAGTLTLSVRVDTPLRTKLIVLAVLAIVVFLFVVEWLRVDVVAILMMVSLPLLGLLDSRATFSGLSSNAVIAIIGVMIVSAGLNRVGLVSRVVRPVIRAAGRSPHRLVVFLSSLIATISSVMQNTGAAVLFLPGIRHASKVMRVRLARVLMPIGMCAILGGTMTMIGTSPLILLNDILPKGVEKFSLLELTPIGLAFVVCGILYFSTVGMRVLRKIADEQAERIGEAESADVGDLRTCYRDLDGPYEIRVPKDWEPGDHVRSLVGIRRVYATNIVAVTGPRGVYEEAPGPNVQIKPRMSLAAFGSEAAIHDFADRYGLEVLRKPARFRTLFNPAVAGTVEAVVLPRSSFVGMTIREIGFRETYGVTVLAVFREGKVYYREMADIPLLAGDALLLHGTWERFHALDQAHQNFTIVTPLEKEIEQPAKARTAVICFVIALAMMLVSSFYFQKMPYNPIPLSVCLMMGALLMVVTGVLHIGEAYQAVDWRTVFLLGGLIPLGMAVDRTGTAEWIAIGVVDALGESVSPLLMIAVLAVLATAFCLVISNVGACTLLVPLGAAMAVQIGIDPRVAAIVVGLGVSNSFLLPTHQVNALYMGPGCYRTKDYMVIGGGMSLIYIAVLVAMTYLFYL